MSRELVKGIRYIRNVLVKYKSSFTSIWCTHSALAAFLAHSVSISIGICQGYSAIWLPQLNSSNDFNITSEESSWLASLGAISNPAGSILSGVLAEYFGRKRSIQISSIPFIVGWLCIGLGQNLHWLYAGRLISGIAAGMSTACYTYVSEISTSTNRGFLQSLGPICASFGILLSYTLGYFIHWATLALLSIAFAVFSMFAIQLVPDSPPYLMKNKDPKTFDAYLFFRRSANVAETEMNEAQAKMDEGVEEKSLKQLYFSAETVKPFLLLITLFLLQELSGIYTILFYAVSFFEQTNIQLNSYISSIIVGSIRFAASVLVALLINKYGRKILCTFSSLGMSVTVLTVACYVKYYELYPDSEKILSYLPLFCIMFNVLFSMVGMLPLPWILVGELFPLRVRPIMSGIVICMAQTFIFICVKIYNNMIDYLKFSGTLFTFFAASVLALLFCKFVLPETKNKSLDEIEDYFRSTKRKSAGSGLKGFENHAFTISSENLSGRKSKENNSIFTVTVVDN